jgi:hypothetical protein
MFMPLIAFAIFAFGPSVMAPIAFIVSLVVHLSPFGGLPPRLPDPITLLLEPPILTIALWPFLMLYGITRGKLIEQPEEWRSIRLATIGATIAMSLPGAALLVGAIVVRCRRRAMRARGWAFSAFSSWCCFGYPAPSAG